MGLGDWLKRRKSEPVWAVKQIDADLLHVCGEAWAEGDLRSDKRLEALRAGHFQGPVRMQENDTVLNAAQFAMLVPHAELALFDEGNAARWQGREWRIAWVPQRCWLYAGRLTVQPVTVQGRPRRLSVEDTNAIRDKAR
ncbi:MAG: hypothetical protein UMU75_10490, partial [Halomonas sp.]|nr:hypothetical protein [Halomonas sp.]